MTNDSLTFIYERKKPGDPIRSRDWNIAMQAITDLSRALRAKTNGLPSGPLTLQGALNVQGALTAATVAATTVTATKFVGDGSGLTNLPTTGSPALASAPANPQRVGQWIAQPGPVNGVYVAGKYAYLAVDNIGLAILDISDPATPRQVGEGGYASLYTRRVQVAGRYAYLATSQMGLDIFDIANVAIPQQVGAANIQATVRDLYISGSYAYLATSDQGLQIIDITNPAAPQSTGPGVPAIGAAQGIYVAGAYAYVATSDQGLQIINISDPTNPQRIGAGVSTVGAAQGVYVAGQYAYVASNDHGLQIVDISDPAAPQPIGEGATGIGSAQGISVAGDYAYVATSDQGLQIVKIAQPVTSQFRSVTSAPSMNAEGTQAWMSSSLMLVDEPRALAGGPSVGDIGSAQAVFVAGRYAYVAAGTAGLQIIDLQGAELFAARIGAVTANVLSVSENATVDNNLYVRSALNVGSGGIKSDGVVTAARFVGDGSGLTGIQGAGGSSPWTAKPDGTGIVYKVGANVTIGATNSGTSLQILNKNQDATGDTLILGRTDASHMRLGYHADYGWLQAGGSRPLCLNPLEGNVGIGTTQASEKLEVNGTVKAIKFVGDGSGLTGLQTGGGSQWTNAANGVIAYNGGNVEVGNFQGEDRFLTFKVAGGNQYRSGVKLWAWQENYGYSLQYDERAQTGNGLHIKTHNQNADGATIMFVGWNGNVGIGTTQASEKLEVNGTVKATKFVGDGSGLTGIQTGGSSQWTSAANGVIHYAGGNVGIGIASPTSALHVGGGKSVRFELGTNQKLSLGGNGPFEVDAPNVVGGRFVVAEAGNVGIGVPRPTEKLEVNGTVKATRFVGDGSGLTGTPVAELQQALRQLADDFYTHIHSYAGLPTTGQHRP